MSIALMPWLCVELAMVGPMQLSQKDEEVLAFLTDITSEDLEGEVDDDGDEIAGFKLAFHFKPNPFFDHDVLVHSFPLFGCRMPV
jgi:hypothetical protein